jgi:hypothetical protein
MAFCFATQDAVEGQAAFKEKRPPAMKPAMSQQFRARCVEPWKSIVDGGWLIVY